MILFVGGFLDLDNIGVFDRSKALPPGLQLEQAHGTAWMPFFCMALLGCAVELAVYEDLANKFFEHTMLIIDAINNFVAGARLWNDENGFYYDHLRSDSRSVFMRIRSLVGLMPLFNVLVFDAKVVMQLKALPREPNGFWRTARIFPFR